MAAWLGGSGVALVCEGLTGRGRAVLQRAIRRAGWTEGQFWVCRVDDIPAGARALVAMGAGPLKALTGFEGGKRAVEYVRGYELPSWTGLPVVPTFDPERVAMGQMKLLGLVMSDIGRAMASTRQRGVVLDPKSEVNYTTGLAALERLYEEAKADPTRVVAFDLETEASSGEDEDEVIEFSRDAEDDARESIEGENGDGQVDNGKGFSRDALDIGRASITTVQFSIAPGTGVSCDWSDDARRLTQLIFDLPNTRAGHNVFLFDWPILFNHGIVTEDLGDDTLWMWHHLQPDLPAHLQGVASLFGMPFPWKHMAGADLAFYGAADVDAVQRIMARLPRDLARLGLWDGYVRYVREFRPVLAEIERRGIPVSREKLGELREWLDREVVRMDGELQPLVPSEVKGRKYWKTWPADTKPWKQALTDYTIQVKKNALQAVGAKVTKKATSCVLKLADVEGPQRADLTAQYGYQWEGDQLYRELDFNPRSSQQILAYLRHRRYPVPTRFKDGADTTSDKELERLEVRTGDPVIKLTRSIRAYSKMRNAYAGKVGEDGQVEGGWQPGPDGRLRATITFGPATGQLAARNPNIMTTPKRREELARKFRQCIVAEPGHKLVEFDYRAFHARTLGLAARDAAYMRLADMDIHSFVAGHMVRHPGVETCLDLSDGDLRQYLEEVKGLHKKVRNFKAKPAILGIGFRMGKRRLFYENRDSYANEAEAGKLIDLLHKLFPRVFEWQEEVCEAAERAGRLTNAWGAPRWFWDVVKWHQRDGRWVKSQGKDAEKATAYLPSSNAHFMLRDKLLQMEQRGWLSNYGLSNVIHDAVLFHCPDNLVEQCVSDVMGLLQAPVLQMACKVVAPEGFVCAAEASVGSDWSNMEEVK